MRRSILLWAVVCLVLASTALCRTWHIEPDGTGDAPTIQAGIDSSSAGDTVLVHPGEYHVNLYMKSYISLVSSGGCDVTILKNDYGEGFPIIYASCRAGLIEGFTLLGEPGKSGPGIILECHSGVLGAEIICNTFDRLAAYEGAGVCCYNHSQAIIIDNVFRSCIGWNAGGGVLVIYGSWARIEGNTFTDCYSKAGGAICCSQEGTCEIIGNRIENNEALQRGGGIFLHECPSGRVEFNVIKGNHADLNGGGVYLYEGNYEMMYNVVWGNVARYGGGVAQAPGAALICENNTFFGNEATERASAADLRGNVASSFMNCIISNSYGASAIDCFGATLPTADCNVFWMNPSDYVGCSPGPHDIIACPSFCFADGGDFHLCDESPCLPGNHPTGYECGLIGALSEGCTCGPTATEPTTWGAIKAMYR